MLLTEKRDKAVKATTFATQTEEEGKKKKKNYIIGNKTIKSTKAYLRKMLSPRYGISLKSRKPGIADVPRH